jgi:hypothetical protein
MDDQTPMNIYGNYAWPLVLIDIGIDALVSLFTLSILATVVSAEKWAYFCGSASNVGNIVTAGTFTATGAKPGDISCEENQSLKLWHH